MEGHLKIVNIQDTSQLIDFIKIFISENMNNINSEDAIGQGAESLPVSHSEINLAVLFEQLFELMAERPGLFEDSVRKFLSSVIREKCNPKVDKLITKEILQILHSTKTPTSTWLAYENLLVHFIKSQMYSADSLTNEALAIVKCEDLNKEIIAKFSSVLKECATQSRKYLSIDEEEEEKWCEIMDWLSWFMMDTGED